jgi:zinc-ribbon domain
MICPNCGEEVPPKAKACPECGSCEETGWSEAAAASGLDLPDEEFDYQDYVKREFDTGSPKPRGLAWIWWVTAVGLLVLAFFGWLFFR